MVRWVAREYFQHPPSGLVLLVQKLFSIVLHEARLPHHDDVELDGMIQTIHTFTFYLLRYCY